MLIEALLVSAGYGIGNMIKADKMNEQALKKLTRAYNSQIDANDEIRRKKEKADKSLEKLVNRKCGIIATSIKEFILIYQKIMTIDFNESDGIMALYNGSQLSASVTTMREMTTITGQSLTSKQTNQSFFVGCLLGGFVGGVTNAIKKEAEINLAAASMISRQTEVAVSQAETIIVVIDSIHQMSERMSALLAKLNVLFRKSIVTTSCIIEKNGRSRLNYTQIDKDYIRTCLNAADALKKIIDAPLLCDGGQISEKVAESLQIGEEYLAKLDEVITREH